MHQATAMSSMTGLTSDMHASLHAKVHKEAEQVRPWLHASVLLVKPQPCQAVHWQRSLPAP